MTEAEYHLAAKFRIILCDWQSAEGGDIPCHYGCPEAYAERDCTAQCGKVAQMLARIARSAQ
jgi:hypothetical protein